MMTLLDRATGVRCLSSLHVVRLPLALFQPLRMGMPKAIGLLLGAGLSWAMVSGTAHAQSPQEASRVGQPAASHGGGLAASQGAGEPCRRNHQGPWNCPTHRAVYYPCGSSPGTRHRCRGTWDRDPAHQEHP
jgi:hypothetical protein